MDYSRLSKKEIEIIGHKGGREAAEMKAIGFKKRAEEARDMLRHAPTKERRDYFKLVESDSVAIYKKYKDQL